MVSSGAVCSVVMAGSSVMACICWAELCCFSMADFNSADVGLPASDLKRSQDETLKTKTESEIAANIFFIELNFYYPTKIIRIADK